MITIKNRFDLLIKTYSQGKEKVFAAKIGVAPTVVNNVTGKRSGNPSFEVLQKILYAFADINAEWLITGKGEMLKRDDENTIPEKPLAKEVDEDKDLKKSALEMIRDLSAENALLKRDIEELRELQKKKNPAVYGLSSAAEPNIGYKKDEK